MFKDKAHLYTIKDSLQHKLPANNISQQLFFKQLPQCHYRAEMSEPWCCRAQIKTSNYYNKTPYNLWKDVNLPTNQCTDQAFQKQAFLSQHYNYLSKNNTLH